MKRGSVDNGPGPVARLVSISQFTRLQWRLSLPPSALPGRAQLALLPQSTVATALNGQPLAVAGALLGALHRVSLSTIYSKYIGKGCSCLRSPDKSPMQPHSLVSISFPPGVHFQCGVVLPLRRLCTNRIFLTLLFNAHTHK